jgi:hypothetical protein
LGFRVDGLGTETELNFSRTAGLLPPLFTKPEDAPENRNADGL